MRHVLVASMAVFIVGAGALRAGAQEAAPPSPEPDPDVTIEPAVPATELKTDEGPIPDPRIPDNLLSRLPRETGPAGPTRRYGKSDYPDEIVKRPLTLAAEQAQISLDMPLAANSGHATLTQILRAAVGITRDWQVGLTYGFGLERLESEAGQNGYEAGRAFSVETSYTIVPQLLAAEVSFGFLAGPDQFGMSLALGVPVKVELGDRWAIFGGRNLIRVKLHGVAVDPADPAYNLDQLDRIARDVPTDDGRVQLDVGVAYQPLPHVAVFGTFGVGWVDFSNDQQPYSLFAGASYTVAHRWDFGARVGFMKLDHLSDSFAAALSGAVRI